MNDDAANPLLNELVTFVQHQLPGLDAGEYQLTLAQHVDDAAGTPIDDGTLTQAYAFAVLGDRFRLQQPADTVYATFPAQNATGEFGTVLPHVVFSKPAFPWSRYPTVDEPSAPAGPVDADVPTWLAVLLFDEDDVARYPSLALEPRPATVGDLFPPQAYAGSTLAGGHSYFDGATDTSDLDAGTVPTDPIQVLDLPLGLFWQVAPTLVDLGLLAHVRTIDLSTRATVPGTSDVGEPVGTFSIVVGNRLPQNGKQQHAFLVSLEGLERVLPTAQQGGAPADTGLAASATLRLAVLSNWTFFSTGQPAAFVDALLSLNGRPAGSTSDAANPNLRLAYGGTDPVVAGALTMGYVPLDHGLRTGGTTVSWYRGPFVPYPIPQRSLALPLASPDAALVFDPTTGMLDASYAAAWTLGRMLALQDVAFSTALYNWKQGVALDVLASLENALLQETFAELLANHTRPLALAGQAAPPPARALLHKLIHSLRG